MSLLDMTGVPLVAVEAVVAGRDDLLGLLAVLPVRPGGGGSLEDWTVQNSVYTNTVQNAVCARCGRYTLHSALYVQCGQASLPPHRHMTAALTKLLHTATGN